MALAAETLIERVDLKCVSGFLAGLVADVLLTGRGADDFENVAP